MRTTAALSALAAAALLALLLWLLTRSEVPEQNPAVRALPAAPPTGVPEVGSAAETDTTEHRASGPESERKPPIPDSIAGVVDESRDGIARMKALDRLGVSRTTEEIEAIRWLLRKSDEHEALRNSAARKLLECGDGHLAGDLTGMLWDEKETPKWRNYCVQFLKDCYDRDGDPAVLDTLFEAAGADEKMVRICAVWSLARVATPRDKSKVPDDETLGRIRAAALDALREKDSHFLIRTAGVQSCARLGLKEALPEVREIAGDEGAKPTHLRVVAAAALGDLGDETDLPLLERLSSSARGQLPPGRGVRSAAALALKKVRERPAF